MRAWWLGVLLSFLPRRASAEPLVSLEASAGMGTPTGWLGAEVLAAPVRPLVLHAGAGLGSVGIQYAAGARFRWFLSERRTFELGASWSTGAVALVPGAQLFPIATSRTAATFYWHQAQLANLEIATSTAVGGWNVRPFLGVGYILNADDAIGVNVVPCRGQRDCDRNDARFVPSLGIAFSHGVL